MTKDEALEAAFFALKYDSNAYGYKEIATIAIKAIEETLATNKESSLVQHERKKFEFDAQFDSGVLENE